MSEDLLPTQSSWLRRVVRKPALIIGVVSTLALLAYEICFRIFRPEDLLASTPGESVPYLFQPFASDILMQTVKIGDLANFGPLGLWYFHMYPPLHQSLLYVLGLPEILTNREVTSEIVDLRLYVVYTVIYGLLNALIFIWARDLTKSIKLSVIVVVLWAIYPGNLQMATLLDGTYLSLYLTTLTFYFLYRFLRTRTPKYLTLWLVAVVLTTYCRPLFQWQFVIPVVLVVGWFWWIQGKQRRPILMACDVALVLLMVALPIKSYLMWGSFSTTTWTGFHRTGMLFYAPPEDLYYAVEVPEHVLANAEVFKSDYNVPVMVVDNYARERLANEWIASHSIGEIATVIGRSISVNFENALIPTSEYFPNQLAQGVPWRAPMERILSTYTYLLLAIGVIISIFVMRGRRGSLHILRVYGWLIGLYAMVAGTLLLQNREYWSEASRIKIFIEIPVWLAATYLAHLIGVRLLERKKRKEISPS